MSSHSIPVSETFFRLPFPGTPSQVDLVHSLHQTFRLLFPHQDRSNRMGNLSESKISLQTGKFHPFQLDAGSFLKLAARTGLDRVCEGDGFYSNSLSSYVRRECRDFRAELVTQGRNRVKELFCYEIKAARSVFSFF